MTSVFAVEQVCAKRGKVSYTVKELTEIAKKYKVRIPKNKSKKSLCEAIENKKKYYVRQIVKYQQRLQEDGGEIIEFKEEKSQVNIILPPAPGGPVMELD